MSEIALPPLPRPPLPRPSPTRPAGATRPAASAAGAFLLTLARELRVAAAASPAVAQPRTANDNRPAYA